VTVDSEAKVINRNAEGTYINELTHKVRLVINLPAKDGTQTK
jgi:hypothetical protein